MKTEFAVQRKCVCMCVLGGRGWYHWANMSHSVQVEASTLQVCVYVLCVCGVYTEKARAESWWKLNLHNSSAAWFWVRPWHWNKSHCCTTQLQSAAAACGACKPPPSTLNTSLLSTLHPSACLVSLCVVITYFVINLHGLYAWSTSVIDSENPLSRTRTHTPSPRLNSRPSFVSVQQGHLPGLPRRRDHEEGQHLRPLFQGWKIVSVKIPFTPRAKPQFH